MEITDKIKHSFGIRRRVPDKIVPAIEAAEAADRVLDTVASLVVDKRAIRPQLDKIGKVKRLPSLVKPYPYYLKLYLQLEKLIVKNETTITKEKYTEEKLRDAIKKKVEVFKLKKPFLYIFLDEDELNLSFIYDLINAFLPEVSSSLKRESISKLEKTYRAIPLFEGVRFSSAGLFPFEPIAQKLKKANVGKGIKGTYAISPIFTSASRFLASIYFEAVDSLGEKQANDLLKKTYDTAKKSYGFLASLPNVAKYLPPGVFEAVGEQKIAAAAAAAAAAASTTEKMMGYVAGIITAPEQVRPITDKLELYKRLPFGEREDAYLMSYLELENFITSHKPPLIKKAYTEESLRDEIKSTFNVRRLKPKFGSLFRIRGIEKLIYYELLIETLIMQIIPDLDVQRIVNDTTKDKLTSGIKIKGAKVDFSVPERKIFNLPPQWHKLITTNFKDLFTELYNKTREKLGEDRARAILEDSYRKLQESYGTLSLFSESLSIFLKGILEDVILLRRDELEARIKERTKELEEAKAYTDNIVKSMIDTLLVVDPDGKIKTINPATVEILGYSEEELIGQPVATIFAEEEEEEEEEEALLFKGTRLEKLLKEGSVRDYDMTYQTKSGEEIPVSFSGSVMYEAGGRKEVISDRLSVIGKNEKEKESEIRNPRSEIVGIVGIARDMREIKQLMEKEKEFAAAAAAAAAETDRRRAAELEKAYNELKNTQAMLVQSEKLASLGQLGGGVAHELNSPLAGVLSLIRSFMKEKDPKSEEYGDLKEMEEASDHMAKIIRDLSDFSRESKGEFKELNFNEVIESTLSFSAHQLKNKGIKIEKNYDENLPLVRGDKSQLQQVIINMITNARDAISLEGVFKITTRSVNTDRMRCVEMEFSDTGCGMSKDILDKIFDPFFTTKRPGGGVGLGLSITHTIVKNHNGEIMVNSEEGKGSTFKVRLPVGDG